MENNDYLEIIKQAYEERIKEIKDKYERIIEGQEERIVELKEQVNYLKKLVDDRDYRLIQIFNQYNSVSGDNVAGSKYDQRAANIGGIIDTAQSESNPTFHQQNNPSKNANNDPKKP